MIVRRTLVCVVAAAVIAASGCAGAGDDEEPRPPEATAAADPVRLVAAGDIASTRRSGRGTARLVERLDPDLVLTLGDHAYPDGSVRDFRRKYHPTWGRFRHATRPVPGNHEYRTPRARGYFRYFREQVDGRRWYAYDVGGWRVYALSCEIRCGRGSRQLRWLRAQLREHGDRPSIAQVHRPFLTCSPHHDPFDGLRPVWRALQRGGTQVVLSGHVHGYERFAPVRADRERSPRGVRQLVAGTGGAESHPVGARCRHRQAARGGVAGVLELTLHPDRYAWRFVTVRGDVRDSGTRRVRPRAPLTAR